MTNTILRIATLLLLLGTTLLTATSCGPPDTAQAKPVNKMDPSGSGVTMQQRQKLIENNPNIPPQLKQRFLANMKQQAAGTTAGQ